MTKINKRRTLNKNKAEISPRTSSDKPSKQSCRKDKRAFKISKELPPFTKSQSMQPTFYRSSRKDLETWRTTSGWLKLSSFWGAWTARKSDKTPRFWEFWWKSFWLRTCYQICVLTQKFTDRTGSVTLVKERLFLRFWGRANDFYCI